MKLRASHYLGYIYKLILIFAISLFSNCNKQKNKQPGINQVKKIHCTYDTSQSYYVYLPSYYNTSKQWPVIYAFDAHGRGNIPVERLAKAAEETGYIICASNNARNNSSYLQYIIDMLFKDSQKRFTIDKNRIYLSGFSGGARIASSIALKFPNIKGIISCAAGTSIPANQIKNKDLIFIGVSGIKDFNYLELQVTHDFLRQNNISSQLIIHDGGHEWPPEDIMSKALYFIYFVDIQKGIAEKNNKLVNQIYKKYKQYSKRSLENNNLLKARQQVNEALFLFNDLKNTRYFKKMHKTIKSSDKFREQLQLQNNLEQIEKKLQSKYQQAFQTKNLDWWKKEIKKIHYYISNEEEHLKKCLHERIRQFNSMLAYIYITNSLKSKNSNKLNKYFTIYHLVDPGNPDYAYLKAKSMMQQNKHDSAIIFLQEAKDNGLTNINRLKTDHSFNALKNHGAFKLLFK